MRWGLLFTIFLAIVAAAFVSKHFIFNQSLIALNKASEDLTGQTRSTGNPIQDYINAHYPQR